MKSSDRVSVFDSKFSDIFPAAIVVNAVEDVKIVSSEFNIKITDVVKAENSPNLYISCNRLIGQPINMECASISNSAMFISSDPTLATISSSLVPMKTEKQDEESVNSILWLLIAVGLLVLSTIFACTMFRLRSNRRKKMEKKSEFVSASSIKENTKLVSETNKADATREVEESNATVENEKQNLMNSESDIITKIKEQEAILNEEISNMRQKSDPSC